MADTQVQRSPIDPIKSILPERGSSANQMIALAILLPLGGILLALAGLTLAATVVGVLVATPVLILFSPIIVPAVLTVGLAVTAFLASGACGLTGMHSMAWILRYARELVGKVVQKVGGEVQEMPEYVEVAKRGMQDTSGQLGQRMKEAGQQVQTQKSP